MLAMYNTYYTYMYITHVCTYWVADKTLIDSGNGLFIIFKAVMVILVPWFVPQCWVQLYHVTLRGE